MVGVEPKSTFLSDEQKRKTYVPKLLKDSGNEIETSEEQFLNALLPMLVQFPLKVTVSRALQLMNISMGIFISSSKVASRSDPHSWKICCPIVTGVPSKVTEAIRVCLNA